MGKESHRRQWETTWPRVKSGETSGRDKKPGPSSGVTFCVPAPVYFLDLSQVFL